MHRGLCISLMAGYLCGWRLRPLPGKGPKQEEGGSPFRGWSEQTPAGEPGVGGNWARCSHCLLPLPRDSEGGVCVGSPEPVRMLTVGGSRL